MNSPEPATSSCGRLMEFVENPFTATLRLLWEDRLFSFVHFAFLCRYRYGQSGGPENSILNSFALAGHFGVRVECESRPISSSAQSSNLLPVTRCRSLLGWVVPSSLAPRHPGSSLLRRPKPRSRSLLNGLVSLIAADDEHTDRFPPTSVPCLSFPSVVNLGSFISQRGSWRGNEKVQKHSEATTPRQ